MRAILVHEPGGPDVLTVGELPDPVAGPGQVVLDVAAAGVNRADLLQREGRYPPPPGAPSHLGLECSGTVAAVGDGVTGWSIGDRACALLTGGGYAERVAVPVGRLLPLPAGIDLIDAASLPEAVCTVWSNLVTVAGLRRDETVLIHGGSGGVGTMAIQIAVALGARVATTAGSAARLARCRELGARILIDHRTQDFVDVVDAETGGRGADVVLDVLGAPYLARNLQVLADGGRLVVIGMQGGRRAELDLGLLLTKRAMVAGTTLRSRPEAEKAEIVAAVHEVVWPWLESGRVRPVVHDRIPLADAERAHRLVAESGHLGKVVLVM